MTAHINHIESPTNPSITRDELFFALDDFTGASTQSIESLKKLLEGVFEWKASYVAASTKQPDWHDEHPDRIGPLRLGDYMPYGVAGQIHFVRLRGPGPEPDDTTACGLQVDDDWMTHPKAHPICGVVNCEDCLALYNAAHTNREDPA